MNIGVATDGNQGRKAMRILHILSDGSTPLSEQIIREQSKNYEIKVIDLSQRKESYESIINDISSFDRVFSW